MSWVVVERERERAREREQEQELGHARHVVVLVLVKIATETRRWGAIYGVLVQWVGFYGWDFTYSRKYHWCDLITKTRHNPLKHCINKLYIGCWRINVDSALSMTVLHIVNQNTLGYNGNQLTPNHHQQTKHNTNTLFPFLAVSKYIYNTTKSHT